MAWPPPTELAILTVNGAEYSDWETVLVRQSLRELPPYLCKFTCSEGMPLSKNFAKLQIMPGMDCTVTLAGILAFTGKVETRQVYYDANRHHIEIQCASLVVTATSSVIHKSMEWKDKTFPQIAKEVLGTVGLNLKFLGGAPPSYKFPRVNATPGESIHDFLDMLARSLSNGSPGISFTSNPAGDFVVAMGPIAGTDSVIEGQNIIIGREKLFRPSSSQVNPSVAQGGGSNDKWGADAAHVPFFSEMLQGTDLEETPFGVAPAVIRNEMASWDKTMLKGRVTSESNWMTGDQVIVLATVYGWLRPSGGLWERDQSVFVTSPMLVMKEESLIANSVTFTQDNQTGTRTTLDLRNANALGKQNPAIT